MTGGGILPFTTQKQNDATSALAGVFSILIGTGSVSLRRYDLVSLPRASIVLLSPPTPVEACMVPIVRDS